MPFPFASPAEIIRADQKDLFYKGLLLEFVSRTFKGFLGKLTPNFFLRLISHAPQLTALTCKNLSPNCKRIEGNYTLSKRACRRLRPALLWTDNVSYWTNSWRRVLRHTASSSKILKGANQSVKVVPDSSRYFNPLPVWETYRDFGKPLGIAARKRRKRRRGLQCAK